LRRKSLALQRRLRRLRNACKKTFNGRCDVIVAVATLQRANQDAPLTIPPFVRI
jgi:hypothetical protein